MKTFYCEQYLPTQVYKVHPKVLWKTVKIKVASVWHEDLHSVMSIAGGQLVKIISKMLIYFWLQLGTSVGRSIHFQRKSFCIFLVRLILLVKSLLHFKSKYHGNDLLGYIGQNV